MRSIFAAALLVSVGSSVLGAQTSSSEAIYAFARTLAGTEVEPVCRVDRDPTDQMTYTDKCVWTFNAASKPESLTVERDPAGKALISWDHVVGDDDGLQAFQERLTPFISANNLAMRDCGEGDSPAGRSRSTAWVSDTYWVYLSRIRNNSLPTRVILFVFDETDDQSFLDLLCKDKWRPGPHAPNWYNLAKIPSSRESSSSWLPVSTTRP